MRLIIAFHIFTFLGALKLVQSFTDCEVVNQLIQEILVSCPMGNSTEDPLCGYDWIHYSGHCYYFSTVKATWRNAEEFCNSFTTSLAQVDDAGENAWIAGNRASNSLWLGGIDVNVEGQWVWSVDSRPISYTAWSSHSGGTAENCMSLNVNDKTWSDNRCANPMEFVCELNGIKKTE